jgi:hypothetical protein
MNINNYENVKYASVNIYHLLLTNLDFLLSCILSIGYYLNVAVTSNYSSFLSFFQFSINISRSTFSEIAPALTIGSSYTVDIS